MNKKYLLFTSLCLSMFATTVFAAPPPPIKPMEPKTIYFGHATNVTFKVPNMTSETQVVISPGGPYKKGSLSFDEKIKAIAATKDHAFIATQSGKIITVKIEDKENKPKQIETFETNADISRLAIYNKTIYAATKDKGLLVIDANSPNNLEVIGKFPAYGHINDIYVTKTRIFIILNNKTLGILKKENGRGDLKLISFFPLEFRANKLFVQENICYIAAGKTGIILLDISNEKQIKEIGKYNTTDTALDIKINGKYAYVADGYGGFLVLDVSNPADIKWIGNNNLYGNIQNIEIVNERAIISRDSSVLVLMDISSPQHPMVISSYKIKKGLNTYTFKGKNILVASDSTIESMDFSDEQIPILTNDGVNLGGSRKVTIRNNIAYVADWFSGFHLYDISKPHMPMLISSLHTPGSPKGVILKDNYAYLTDDDHGLHVIEISDPLNLKIVRTVPTRGLAYTMDIVENTLYLADHRGGFHILDISKPELTHIIGSFDTPGKSWSIVARGNIAYVADDSSGLLIFDVANPAKPKQIGQFNPNGFAEEVRIRGNIAFVAFFDKGFYILDISDPANPKEIGHTPTPGSGRGIELNGNYAYISDWKSGVQIIDISNLSAPKIIGSYDSRGSVWGLAIKDNHAFVMDWWGGFLVLNIKDPANPVFEGRYHGRSKIQDIKISGRYAFLASGSSGVRVFDIKNPLFPVWVRGVDIDGIAKNIWLDGKYAYVAVEDGGVSIVDISTPHEAKHIGKIRTSDSVFSVKINNGFAYVADSKTGIAVFDISRIPDMRYVEQVSSYKADLSDFQIEDDELFLATSKGLEIVSIKDPNFPTLLKEYKTENKVTIVRTAKNLLYIYEENKGIWRLKTDKNKFKELSFLDLGDEITDIKIADNTMYLIGKKAGLIEVDISNETEMQIKNIYPSEKNLTKLDISRNHAFIAGEKILSVIKLIPQMSVTKDITNTIHIAVPKTLPLGDYHVLFLHTDGKNDIINNGIKVVMPPRSEPKFTMEDFEKILKEKMEAKKNQ